MTFQAKILIATFESKVKCSSKKKKSIKLCIYITFIYRSNADYVSFVLPWPARSFFLLEMGMEYLLLMILLCHSNQLMMCHSLQCIDLAWVSIQDALPPDLLAIFCDYTHSRPIITNCLPTKGRGLCDIYTAFPMSGHLSRPLKCIRNYRDQLFLYIEHLKNIYENDWQGY